MSSRLRSAFSAPSAQAGLASHRWVGITSELAGWLLLFVSVTAAAIPIYGQVTGKFRLVPVLSNSMAPKMNRGDLARVEPKPTRELVVGDVLVFNSPVRGSTESRRVIHRIIEIVNPRTVRESEESPGALYIRTKGDANPDADPWIASIADDAVFVRTGVVPGIGRPLLIGGEAQIRAIALIGAGLLVASFGISTLRSETPARPAKKVKTWTPLRSPLARPAGRVKASTPVRSRLAGPPIFELPPFWRLPPRLHETAGVSGAAAAEVSLRSSLAVGAIAALCVGAAGVTAAVAAYLVDNEESAGNIAAGAVVLEIGSSTLQVTVTDLLPGEQAERVVELVNTGSIPLSTVQLEVTGAADPILDPTNGLQLSVQRCSAAWETGTTEGRPTASCGAASTTLVGERPLLGRTELQLAELDADVPGGTDHLRLQIGLPDDAPASLAGANTSVNVYFLAGQREANFR